MPPASELLCPACIEELNLTMITAVAAIVSNGEQGLCVRCKKPLPTDVQKA